MRQRQGAEILVVLVSIAAIAQACAPRKPIVPPAPSVQPAVVDDLNALIQRGCFRCLEEAYAAAQTRMAPQQAFEAAALLVLRSKELGLPTDPWLARARAAAEADDSWATYVDMIDAVPADPLSGDRETLASTTRTGSRLTATITPSSTRALVPKWREALQSGGTSVYFRAYLDVALACSFEGPDERDGAVKAVVEQHGSVPLLQYRTGICGVSYASPLRTLREADAEFVDADYALGRFELQKVEGQDQEAAMRWLQSAAKAFPASPAIAVTIGSLYQTWEEWELAMDAYDRAIALVPSQPDALLGRTIALSQLSRFDDAIASATTLIDGRWYVGQAYYWRGWNHMKEGAYLLARSDTDSARRLMVNAQVFLLSGLVEWGMRRLETAEKDLEEALTMDFGQCDAALYLGAVREERGKLPEAIAALNQAKQCFDLAIAVRRGLIEKIAAAGGSEPTRARQIASQERAIAENETRRAQAIKAVAILSEQLAAQAAPPRSPAPSPPRRAR